MLTFGVAGRYGYHIFAPFAVGSETLEIVTKLLLRHIVCVKVVTPSGAVTSLIVCYTEEVVFVVEYPIGYVIIEFLSTTYRRHFAFFKAL